MALIDLNCLKRFLTKVKELINNHTHSQYFSVNGGTINGDTNVNGVFKVKGQQAFYYSGTSQTVGTDNATGGTVICCGPDAEVDMHGRVLKLSSIVPKSTGTYILGNSTYRWKGIYSTTALNVSSDARLKKNVHGIKPEDMADFVSGLTVVSYNYKDDPEDAEPRIGLIAQDVQSVNPEISKFFVEEGEDGMLSLRPSDLVFPLIATVQELNRKVEELSKKLEN